MAAAVKSLLSLDLADASKIVERVMKCTMYEVLELRSEHSHDGYVATHEKLTIKIQNKESSETRYVLTFHVKFEPQTDLRAKPHLCDFSVNDKVFWKEENLYTMIWPRLIENYNFIKWMPDFYLATPGGFVLEDMNCNGYERCELFNDSNRITAAIASLARFHCSSIVLEAKLAKEICPEMTIKVKFFEIFEELMFDEWLIIGQLYRIGVEIASLLGAMLYNYSVDELRDILIDAGEMTKESATHRNGICHGDLRKENIRFKETSEALVICYFTNFYFMRYAPMVLDLLQLLYLHTDQEYRATMEKEFLKIYQDNMKQTVSHFSNIPDGVEIVVPSLQEVEAAFEELRLFGPAVASVYIALNLLDEENIEDFLEEPRLPDDFMTSEILRSCHGRLEDNDELKKRFGEVIKESLDLCS